MPGTERVDPKIEQGQVAKDSVKKFGDEGAISRREIARPQKPRENGVGKLLARPPLSKRGQRESSGTKVGRHGGSSARLLDAKSGPESVRGEVKNIARRSARST